MKDAEDDDEHEDELSFLVSVAPSERSQPLASTANLQLGLVPNQQLYPTDWFVVIEIEFQDSSVLFDVHSCPSWIALICLR
jgi:hypothetical protein